MPDVRWWVLVAVLVAVVAFLSGVVRGMTGTAPFEVDASATTIRPIGPSNMSLTDSDLLRSVLQHV